MDISLFVGPLIPLFWTSGDVCPGFQSQVGSPCLHASLPKCTRILRFTSGATPAEVLAASMACQVGLISYKKTEALHTNRNLFTVLQGQVQCSVLKDHPLCFTIINHALYSQHTKSALLKSQILIFKSVQFFVII